MHQSLGLKTISSVIEHSLTPDSRHYLGNGLIKASILLFYRRLVSRTNTKFFHQIIHACLAMVISYTIIITCLLLFSCRPIDAAWMRMNPMYTKTFTCIDVPATARASALINVIFDFIITALPLLFLSQLQIQRKQKLAISALFALGFLSVLPG